MIIPQKFVGLAVLVGGWALIQPAPVEAAKHSKVSAERFHKLAHTHARQAAGQSPDLGFGSIPLPLPPSLIRLYDKNLRHQGPIPPPIPGFLLQNPLPPGLAARAAYRRAFALELARERALADSDVSGGIFFTPPLGTPYYPVKSLNLFNYLPVFRILGG
jgi:hypothetical protein